MIKNKYLTQAEKTLDLYFGKKAPAMPENIKELIVKYFPYMIILGLLLTIPGIIMAFGLRSLWAPYAYLGGVRRSFNFSFWGLLSLVALVLQALAIPGLLKKSRKSWEYLFYASLVTALASLLNFDLGALVIGSAISFYILFQIKSFYKN